MNQSPRRFTRIHCHFPVAMAMLCVLLWAIEPQIALSQPTGASMAPIKQESAEGDQLLFAGARAYQEGNYGEAARLFEESLIVFRRDIGENNARTISSMNNLAESYLALGQFDKAWSLHQQTLDAILIAFGEDIVIEMLVDLAKVYDKFDRHDHVSTLQEKLLKLRRHKLGEGDFKTIRSMINLAETYETLGQYDKTLTLMEQALRLIRVKLGEEHNETLALMSNLSLVYHSIGQYDKALGIQEHVLKIKRAKLGENHPDTISMMYNLTKTYRASGQYVKAMTLGEEGFSLSRVNLGKDDTNTLEAMIELASTYRDAGQANRALKLGEEALSLSRVKLSQRHPLSVLIMYNLALTYRDIGQNNKAIPIFLQTLDLLRSTKIPEDHPYILDLEANLAVTYSDLGQYDNALALIPAIVSGVEKLRALPSLATEQRQSIFAAYSDNYQQYAKWYVDAQRPVDGFNLGDLSKARTLTESIKAQVALRSLPAAEQQKLQASEARIQALLVQIEKLSANTRDTTTVLALQKQLDAHNAAHLQLVANLNDRFPKYAQLTNLKPATASDAKKLLGSGDVFVSYLVHSKGQAQAFVLDASGEPKWVDLGQIKNHTQTVAATRELISPSARDSEKGRLVTLKEGGYQWLQPGQANPKDASAAASNPNDARKQLNRYWHDKLIKPIQPLAGTSLRWIISPDKDLALLPFDTLPETINEAGEHGKTLAQTRNLTLVQSFAVYALLRQREAEYAKLQRPKELFAMGNAVYADGWAENRGVKRGSGERSYTIRNASMLEPDNSATPLKAVAEQYTIGQLNWKNLPGTAREVKAVSAVFGTNAKGGAGGADSYFGQDASEGKLQQHNETGKLKDYRYLLFSAHGYLAQNPALSSLVLSLQGNPPGIDGHVTASEWSLYDVKSDLTVLSACDTGVGKTQAGESVMGLPYALFVAGNKNTLLSLWPVDDDATAEFMKRFFTKLKAGIKQPDALTDTKREFMQHLKWSAPKYWAAFVLYGI